MNVIKLQQTASTNNFLLGYVKENNLQEGTIIWTKNQTKGKGQAGSKWFTEPSKNLTFSILLTPFFLNIKNHAYLNMAISLSIYEVLQTKVKNLFLKWPNDIFINDKKMGGVLIENVLQKETIQKSIVGIGLNINQKIFNQELKNKATSLFLETKKTYDLEKILLELQNQIMSFYHILKLRKFNELKNEYEQKLYRLNQKHFFVTKKNQKFEGTIKGVNQQGQIIIHKGNCEKVFSNKEIRFF